MSTGIYKITNLKNNHAYIGLSKNIEKRYKEHISKAINSNRKDDLDKVLYKAIRKHGEENFSLEILEICEESQLKEREIYWIEYYQTYTNREHYNTTPGGDLPGYNTVHLGEDHGMAKLSTEDVVFCRKCYAEGLRCREIYRNHFLHKINLGGFTRMWHGSTWKHIMPEVFKNNPHKGRYTEDDCLVINELFKNSGLSLNKFVQTEECFVGYGTAYNMTKKPEFYKGK